jgi:hypothetical protein
MANAVNFYRVWNSVLLHCVRSPGVYDAVKYKFKVRLPRNFAQKHPDRYVYESFGKKLQTTENMVFFSLANIHAGVYYVRECDMSHYVEFMQIQDGLAYWVEQDSKKIKRYIQPLPNKDFFFFGSSERDCPEVITWARQKKINFQTLLVLQKYSNLLDRCIHHDPIYTQVINYFKSASQLLLVKNKERIIDITKNELCL